jgi:hypothetical protein
MAIKAAARFSRALFLVFAIFTAVLAAVAAIGEFVSLRIVEDYVFGGVIQLATQVPKFLFFGIGAAMPKLMFNRFMESGATRRQFAGGVTISAILACLAFTALRLALDIAFQAMNPLALAVFFFAAISSFFFGLLLVLPAIVRSWQGALGYLGFFLLIPTLSEENGAVMVLAFSAAFAAVGAIYFYVAIRHARIRA